MMLINMFRKNGQSPTAVGRRIIKDPKVQNFLRVIHDPSDAKIDIVAVHGLNPTNKDFHAEMTWTAPNDSMWLKDFLPMTLPSARILLFGYNANVAFGTSVAGVREQAENLLNRLTGRRRDSLDRPIIFICHSLGGLVVKRALIISKATGKYRSIKNATYGIAFFGTPHRGGNHVPLGNIAASIARFALRNPEPSFMEALSKDSLFADDLVEDFRQQLEDYYILSFFETQPYKAFGLVVDKQSATLGLPADRETQIALAGNHMDICKFESNDSDAYEQVRDNLADLATRAMQAAAEKARLAALSVPSPEQLSLITMVEQVSKSARWLEALSNKQDDAKQEEALNSLSPLDFTGIHRDLLHEKRERKTSTWVLRDYTFKSWFNTTNSCNKNTEFALSGDPGSGKSVLCSVIIDHLQSKSKDHRITPITYIYGQYQERGIQSAENVVGSFVKQLALQCGGRQHITWVRGNREQGYSPRLSQLVDLALRVSDPASAIYLIVDGLDEMRPDTLDGLQTLIKAFQERNEIAFHVVWSGRPYAVEKNRGRSCRTIDVQARKEDVKSLVKRRILKNANMRAVTEGDLSWQGRIIAGITNKAMSQPAPFALAHAFVERVAEEPTKADVGDAVKRLCQTLPQHLDETLRRIREGPRAKIAFRTFAWLMAAKTVLHQSQLREALAINVDDPRLINNRKPPIEVIIEACKGLVIVKEGTGAVEIFHHSVTEHLSRQPEFSELAPVVGQHCLHYMLYSDFRNPCESNDEIENRRVQYPLAAYLSVFWADHVRGHPENVLTGRLVELLTSPAMLSIIQLLPPLKTLESRLIGHFSVPRTKWWDCDKVALSLAVSFGLRRITEQLIASAHDVNFVIPERQRYAPIHMAVYLADVPLVQTLIDNRADLNLQDKWGLTPLHLAMSVSIPTIRLKLTRLLCDAGASTAIQDQDGDTALHAAVIHADVDIVKCLIKYVRDINAWNFRHETALHCAVMREKVEIVPVLLEAGANAGILNYDNISPFRMSIRNMSVDMVSCILDSSKARQWNWVLPASDISEGELFLRDRARMKLDRTLGRGWAFHLGDSCSRRFSDEVVWAVNKGDAEWLLRLMKDPRTLLMLQQPTLLHQAIWTRRHGIVVLMVACGARILDRSSNGKNAKDIAELLGDASIIKLLDGGWENERFAGKTGLQWKVEVESRRRSGSTAG